MGYDEYLDLYYSINPRMSSELQSDRLAESAALPFFDRMPSSESSIFSSKPFIFIIQGKQLYVHAALIADCSQPLDRMINGHLSEAQQGFAILEDVDEETFVRFIRWVYSKDYPAPEHALVESCNETTETSKDACTFDEDFGWGTWSSKKDKKKKNTGQSASLKGSLRESFIMQYDLLSSGHTCDPSIPGPRGNVAPEEDYTEVFLGHARMYVFAEKYDIQPLKTLALLKLHRTLSIFTLFPERTGDIMTLLKYVYANTAETVDSNEDIRPMLVHYIGTEMETLSKDGEIKDMMLDNGEMLGDFLKMFASRVSCQ